MGKKVKKTAKARKDRFYQLAKETGYRSRAAFKLIQLNRKYEFLQKSRVVVDLCAAPGGWLQAIVENTPVSCLIIGVDLVPIKPIPNVIALQADITTDKCQQMLKKELQQWKVDCVLNDGAPNMGISWLHDAFHQVQLTLSALKLATELLRRGGWFVTKVFRCKDYYSLMWVLQQLFKTVHATKPQASRSESAEIFIVCQDYTAPDKIDQKFLDPKYVFGDVNDIPRLSIDMIHPEKKTRRREGYPEGDYTLYHRLNVSDFFQKDNYLQLLVESSEIVLDDKTIADHPLTTTEIKECCKDIRVLGKRDLKRLIAWRRCLNELLESLKEKPEEKVEKEESDEELKLEETLADLKEQERKTIKKKLKKIRGKKIKLQRRMDLKMVLPNDKLEVSDDISMFSLSRIKKKKELEKIQDGDLSLINEDILENGNIGTEKTLPKQRSKITYEKDKKEFLDDYYESKEDDDAYTSDISLFSDSDVTDLKNSQEVYEEDNPLMVSLENEDRNTLWKMNSWFGKNSFADINIEDDIHIEDDDDEMSSKVQNPEEEVSSDKFDSERTGGDEEEDRDVTEKTKDTGESEESGDETDSDSSSEDNDDEETDSGTNSEDGNGEKLDTSTGKNSKGNATLDLQLDPEGLALGEVLVQSRKKRREIIEKSYHRYSFNDDNLPEWFTNDEEKHRKIYLPVSKEKIQQYNELLKNANARPIKKIIEAKARKRHRKLNKLEKARKKAQHITDDIDITERERWMQIKQIYKKAGLVNKKKKEVTYVIAKKGGRTKGSRPNGPYRVVDRRLKKDKRSAKLHAKRKNGKKGRK